MPASRGAALQREGAQQVNGRSKLVPFASALRRPDPKRVAQFAETARRLQRERAAAEESVTKLLRETPRLMWRRLATRHELQTSGALECLAREIERRRDIDPAEALLLAELGVAIADALQPGLYPAIILAQLRAHAWKDRAQALAYLGRYDEALHAVEKGESLLQSFGTLGHDRAIVRFVRGVILQSMHRYEESLAALTESRVVFSDHGDSRRCLLCGIAEGALLQRQHRSREALHVYLPLVPIAEELRDEESLACLYNVIGHCHVELGDLPAAESHLSQAVERFGRLQQPLSAAKAELARGRMLLRRGMRAEAIAHLASTRDVFLRQDLIEEAGLCGLDMVEAFLGEGSYAAAETLVRRIIEEFTVAHLSARALVALGYLNDVIAERGQSLQTVDTVRDYILSLRTSPEREFAAFA